MVGVRVGSGDDGDVDNIMMIMMMMMTRRKRCMQ